MLSQTPQPLKRHGSDEQAVAQLGTGIHTGDLGNAGIHQGGHSVTSNKLDCDPPYRKFLKGKRQSRMKIVSYAADHVKLVLRKDKSGVGL
ncbi:hypothetical protein SK128_017243 [Halocaridina rubra]|uniref:Uncharacterized protein n=1 Tax=Halocaridina rubra TaxID=373956 RepID=A0AAN8ZU62_HALRR